MPGQKLLGKQMVLIGGLPLVIMSNTISPKKHFAQFPWKWSHWLIPRKIKQLLTNIQQNLIRPTTCDIIAKCSDCMDYCNSLHTWRFENKPHEHMNTWRLGKKIPSHSSPREPGDLLWSVGFPHGSLPEETCAMGPAGNPKKSRKLISWNPKNFRCKLFVFGDGGCFFR